MRRFFRVLFVVVTCIGAAGAYVAYPLYTVWNIREAIHSGNSNYLADKIEWASLKQSLKPSIGRMALDLPPEEGEDWANVKPNVWQRLKSYFGQGMVDRLVDKYVTPEGLPQLLSYRKAYRNTVATAAPSDDSTRPFTERIKSFWSRVRRAEFMDWSRFEIEVVDKTNEDRVFAAVLALRGVEWKLTELRVRKGAANTAAASDMEQPTQQH